ncbi:hypothetical protein [Kribbella italica]|uniref:DUF998 domain-containing protein n=1 Tax=Kribbella italica TaxID=1540520 RepID=A0A7W9JAK6_9ACTN|nr:hypothetical protein [Kribbella italica]MBB5838344.1 hypothetical protein [Kribbella italica]
MTRRILPALGLFFLSPLVAEFLLGNLPVTSLYALFALAPLCGGGAVLIRELVRHRGWGYPSVVLLALAYGVLEEGVTTQSLFNPNYADLRLLDPGHVGWLGMGVPWTLFVLTLHTVWSVTVPIVLVESLSSRRPWFGRRGLVAFGVIFGFGLVVTTAFQLQSDSFMASAGQFVGVAVAIAVLVVLAVRAGRPAVRGAGGVPADWMAGVFGVVVSSAFMVVDDVELGAWVRVGAMLVLFAVAVVVVRGWSRRAAWSGRHSMALAGGTLLTYAWHAFPEHPVVDASKGVDLAGNVVFGVLAVGLVLVCWIRSGRSVDATIQV